MKLLDRNKDLPVILVGGKYNGQEMRVKDLINLPEFTGELSHDASESRDRGACVQRAELDCLPILEGYTSMWDGNKVRYETWEVYRMLSI